MNKLNSLDFIHTKLSLEKSYSGSYNPSYFLKKNILVRNFEAHLKKMKNKKIFAQNQEFQSASTLQKTISSISFSKAPRFSLEKTIDNKDFLNFPSTLKKNKFNFGLGEKRYIPKYIENNAKINPSPTKYILIDDLTKSPIKNIKKGKSFGISYAYYQKNFVPESKLQNLEVNKSNPGPGKYINNLLEFGNKAIKNKHKLFVTIKGESKNYIDNEIDRCQSPKKMYFPDFNSVEENRYRKISFGKGKKFDFTITPSKDNPGPGQYESETKKTSTIKKKLKEIGKNNNHF